MGPGFTGSVPPNIFEGNSCEICYRCKITLVALPLLAILI